MKKQGEKAKNQRENLIQSGEASCVFVCTNTFQLARRDNRPFPDFWKLIPHFEPSTIGIIETSGTIETTGTYKTIRASEIIRYQ